LKNCAGRDRIMMGRNKTETIVNEFGGSNRKVNLGKARDYVVCKMNMFKYLGWSQKDNYVWPCRWMKWREVSDIFKPLKFKSKLM